MKKKRQHITVHKFDKISDTGQPMAIIDGMKLYIENTETCFPSVGETWKVKLRHYNKEGRFMIFTPIEKIPSSESKR